MPGGGGYSPVADQNGEQQQARPAARVSPPRNFSGGRGFRAPSSPRVSPDSGTRSPPPPVLARAQKRRFVWTPELHSAFVAAVSTLGLDNAKPKSILRLMNVDGLTKANIKSHLQKYRLLLQKRAASDPHAAHPYAALHGGGGYGQWPAAAQQAAAEQQVLLASLGGGGWQAAAFANAGLHAALAGGGGGGGAGGGGAASAAADQANLADIVPGVGELEAYQQAHAQLQLQLYLQGRLGGAGALDGLT